MDILLAILKLIAASLSLITAFIAYETVLEKRRDLVNTLDPKNKY